MQTAETVTAASISPRAGTVQLGIEAGHPYFEAFKSRTFRYRQLTSADIAEITPMAVFAEITSNTFNPVDFVQSCGSKAEHHDFESNKLDRIDNQWDAGGTNAL